MMLNLTIRYCVQERTSTHKHLQPEAYTCQSKFKS
uniref:Uncharacterized protein n=1 Tax=Rhizophora mucronata TaxID=61149 RepID=A0A2P2M8P2_RHIMU